MLFATFRLLILQNAFRNTYTSDPIPDCSDTNIPHNYPKLFFVSSVIAFCKAECDRSAANCFGYVIDSRDNTQCLIYESSCRYTSTDPTKTFYERGAAGKRPIITTKKPKPKPPPVPVPLAQCKSYKTANGAMEPKLMYRVYSHYWFNCEVNYHVEGTSSYRKAVLCTKDATWSERNLRCIKVQCSGNSFSSKNGFLTNLQDLYDPGNYAFQCNTHYFLSDHISANTNVACQTNGKWSTTSLSCQLLKCSSSVIHTIHATFDIHSTPNLQHLPLVSDPLREYKFNCEPKYFFEDTNSLSATVKCQYDGQWNRTNLICKQIGCDGDILSSNLTGTFDLAPYLAGQLYNYNCSQNFFNSISQTSTKFQCTSNVQTVQGFWVPDLTECQARRVCKMSHMYGKPVSFATVCCGVLHKQIELYAEVATNVIPTCKSAQRLIFGNITDVKFLTKEEIGQLKRLIDNIRTLRKAPDIYILSTLIVHSLGCSISIILLSTATIFALFSFRSRLTSLSLSNLFSVLILLCAYLLLLFPCSTSDIIRILNVHSNCDAIDIAIQFLFTWSFQFQLFKAIELLGIHGNILSNFDFNHPSLMALSSLIVPTVHTVLSMTSHLQISLLIVVNMVMLWSTLIISESWSCAPFPLLRICRNDPTSDQIYFAHLQFWQFPEILLSFTTWVIEIAAVACENLFLNILGSNLSVALATVVLVAQVGGTARFIRISRRYKIFQPIKPARHVQNKYVLRSMQITIPQS